MIARLYAFIYALLHPEIVEMAIVRRYVDAQKRFIGELYLGGKLIGMSCDTLPFAAGVEGTATAASLDFYEFTDPMPLGTIRVGGNTPQETLQVRIEIAKRRYCKFRWQIRHGFVEHVMESDYV